MLALAAPITLSTPAMAQQSGPFADVPADHWAYGAVDTLQKAGIVIGYPDGTYGGKRAMTRYEFAVAIARLLPLIQNANSGNYATKDDLAALRQDIETKLQANSDAIDALQKLVDEFTPELQKLGQDVAAAKDRLDSLEARVAAVEEEQRRIRFTGAVNLITEGDDVTNGHSFVDGNGTTVGGSKHLLQTNSVYQDFLLSIRGHVSDNTTANVKLDFGNYLSAIGNTAAPGYSAGGAAPTELVPGMLTAANEQTTVWEANVVTGARLGGAGGAGVTIGRFGNQWTPYTLKQVDPDIYTQLYQNDSGDITTDGGKFDYNHNRFDLQGWGGTMNAIPYSEPWGGPAPGPGTQVGARPAGLIVDNHATALFQGAGARATYGYTDTGVFGVTFERFAATTNFIDPNDDKRYTTLTVYGVDYNGLFPIVKSGIQLIGSYTDAATATSDRGVNDTGNNWRYSSLDTQIGRQFGPVWLQGGYQYVGPEFTSPGSWGRLSTWINPTNVEGAVGSGKIDLGKSLVLSGDVEGYQAAYGGLDHGGDINSPLQQGDKLSHYKVGLDYLCSAGYDTLISYEESAYDLKNEDHNPLFNAGSPTDDLFTIGVGHSLANNSNVRLEYQHDEYNDKGTNFGGGNSAGNIFATQVTAKF